MVRAIRQSWKVLGLCTCILAGCQGTLPTSGPLSMQTPGRVPPPGTGSFNVPGGAYSGAPSISGSGSSNMQSLPSTKPLSQNSPTGTGVVDALREESWHALNDGKVVMASAANDVANQVQNSVHQATNVAQAGFQRITNRLAEETSRIADEIAPPMAPMGTTRIGDREFDPPSDGNLPKPTEESAWRKPQNP